MRESECKVCCGASILVGVHLPKRSSHLLAETQAVLKRFLEGIGNSGALSGKDPSPLDTCNWVLC